MGTARNVFGATRSCQEKKIINEVTIVGITMTDNRIHEYEILNIPKGNFIHGNGGVDDTVCTIGNGATPHRCPFNQEVICDRSIRDTGLPVIRLTANILTQIRLNPNILCCPHLVGNQANCTKDSLGHHYPDVRIVALEGDSSQGSAISSQQEINKENPRIFAWQNIVNDGGGAP